MASSLPTMDIMGTLRSAAECPVCFEVPRNAIMLQCRNGHNICATCKIQLGRIKCRQGRCSFDAPPRRNKTVADLIESFPLFHFPYKSAKDNKASCSGLCSLVKVDLEAVRKHAECPICYEVPRYGTMLMCRNNHNICVTCKIQLDKDAKCPQGRCDFDFPPRINRTVARLVDSLPFEFACKYSSASDANHSACDFKSTKDMLFMLEWHEGDCQHRPVPCPHYSCEQSVSADKVVGHLSAVHKLPFSWAAGVDPDVINAVLMFDSWNSGDRNWETSPHETSFGWAMPGACFEGGFMFIWLQLGAHSTVTQGFRCTITLSCERSSNMSFYAPVFPIDWTRERIMEDVECVRFNILRILHMLTEMTFNNEKKRGFKTTFKIIKNAP